MKQALETTRHIPPHTQVKIMDGLTARRTAAGIAFIKLHYSADPLKNPANPVGAAWVKAEKAKTTSKARWDREMEIIHAAGGGERVFADVLTQYGDKIIITDPSWQPNKYWTVLGGFDHGRTNPTAALVAYVDFDGVIYIAAEYYHPGRLIYENAPYLKELPGFSQSEYILADPSMFVPSSQANGKTSSFADEYTDQGIVNLIPYGGDKSDAKFVERLSLHWMNLDQREPTVKIVCRMPIPDKPIVGLNPTDCPCLLWELMQSRRVKLTETQLLSKNASEALVDKNNHAFDALKYLIMSLPEPTQKTKEMVIRERTQGMDATNTMIWAGKIAEEFEEREAPIRLGGFRATRGIGMRRR